MRGASCGITSTSCDSQFAVRASASSIWLVKDIDRSHEGVLTPHCHDSGMCQLALERSRHLVGKP